MSVNISGVNFWVRYILWLHEIRKIPFSKSFTKEQPRLRHRWIDLHKLRNFSTISRECGDEVKLYYHHRSLSCRSKSCCPIIHKMAILRLYFTSPPFQYPCHVGCPSNKQSHIESSPKCTAIGRAVDLSEVFLLTGNLYYLASYSQSLKGHLAIEGTPQIGHS